MLVIAITWLILSVLVGIVGKDRKLGFVGFFILSLVFSPLLVVFALLLTLPKTPKSTL